MIDLNKFVSDLEESWNNLEADSADFYLAHSKEVLVEGEPAEDVYEGEILLDVVSRGNPTYGFVVAQVEDEDIAKLIALLLNATPDLLFALKDYRRAQAANPEC